MNILTIVIWIIIAIIGIGASVFVKKHYSNKELETSKKEELSNESFINEMIYNGKEKIKPSNNSQNNSFNPDLKPKFQSDIYIKPQDSIKNEVETASQNYNYESANQVLINYEKEVKKFQEPIKQNQMDIMTQNNKEKTELKDLFTIDELIEESKRKDSERLKESQKINNEADEDLTEIKQSIENKTAEPLIEEIVEDESHEESISDLINEEEEKETEKKDLPEIDSQFAASQKDIEEAITTASKESEKEEIESISESGNITDVLLNADDDSQDIPNEEIKQPTLKTPSKVGESKDYEFGAPIDDADLFEDDENTMDLDYRKDLDKFTNKIKGSKIFQEVKDKFVQEEEELPQDDGESYIRNVNEYDEFEPIINETHVDFDASYEDLHSLSDDERLRQENTRKVFKMAKGSSKELEKAQAIGEIKNKPARDNIKINLNNNEVVLKKGDEIIFNHLGETYSSQVYAINGDDISVRYRRKDITIKPEDVKKIY